MHTVTFISNGHGEDLIAARVATALLKLDPTLQLQAFPLVGRGTAMEQAGLSVLGPRRELPAAGLTLHSLPLFAADLRAGLVSVTLQQLRELRQVRTQVVVAVGDVYAQLLAALVPARQRFVIQTLVSTRHCHTGLPAPNRFLMERISLPERWLLRRAAAVWLRDEPTAAWLRSAGVVQARFRGNPAVDGLAAEPLSGFEGRPVVLLLPGSRSYAQQALATMLQVAALRPEVAFIVAWAGAEIPQVPGWSSEVTAGSHGAGGQLIRESQRVAFYRDGFPQLLATARLALGAAGTAHEQAAALGVPVIGFPVPPHYSTAFLANQKRLLGRALQVSGAQPQLLAGELDRLLQSGPEREGAVADGIERMGAAGGSQRIALEILQQLKTGS